MSTDAERIDRLEEDAQEQRHLGKVRHDALGDALNRTHADLLAFREETRNEFAEVKATLREILDRLPPAGGTA